MKKFYPLIIITAFFSASQAFSLENNAATQASQSTPINLVQEKQKLVAEMEQNIDDEGALEEEGEEASEQELYQIELLVFAYVNTGEENSEIWRNPKRPDFAHFKEALDESMENQEASIQQNKQLQKNLSAIIQHKQKQEEQEKSIERHFLDPEADDVSEFKSIMRKMSINGHYRTLKHLVWQQQVLPREARDLFYLQGGENYLTESDLPSLNADANTIKPFADHQNVSNDETSESNKAPAPYLNQGPGVPELEGSLHIYRSRFLHVVPDLWFTQFAPNDAGQCLVDEPEISNTAHNPETTEIPETSEVQSYTPLINFNLKQRRRLRSGELHYLDHPRFGVLIVFNKVSEDKENTETEQSTNADQENPS